METVPLRMEVLCSCDSEGIDCRTPVVIITSRQNRRDQIRPHRQCKGDSDQDPQEEHRDIERTASCSDTSVRQLATTHISDLGRAVGRKIQHAQQPAARLRMLVWGMNGLPTNCGMGEPRRVQRLPKIAVRCNKDEEFLLLDGRQISVDISIYQIFLLNSGHRPNSNYGLLCRDVRTWHGITVGRLDCLYLRTRYSPIGVLGYSQGYGRSIHPTNGARGAQASASTHPIRSWLLAGNRSARFLAAILMVSR